MKVLCAVLSAEQQPNLDSEKVRYSLEEGEVDPFKWKSTEVLRLDDFDPFGMTQLLRCLVIIAVLFDDSHSQYFALHDDHG